MPNRPEDPTSGAPQGPSPVTVEYQDLSANMRHYGNLEFAQMSIFLAITGGLLALLSKADCPPSPWEIRGLCVLGITLTLAFWVKFRRVVKHWHSYNARAMEIETQLGLAQYSRRPPSRRLSNRNAGYVVYGAVCVLWLVRIVVSFVACH